MATEDTPMHDAEFQSNSRMISNGSNQEIRLAIARLAELQKISSGQKDDLMEMVGNQDSAMLAVIARNFDSQEALEAALLEMVNPSSSSTSSSAPSSLSPTATSSDGAAPMEDDGDDSVDSGDAALRDAVKKLVAEANTNSKIRTAKQSVTNLKKILDALLTHPEKAKNRTLKKKVFSIKKFILDVPGAVDILLAVGFQEKTEKKAEVLSISAEQCMSGAEHFATALELLQESVERMTPITNPTSGPRALCTAGCTFFGDAELDGLCSKCHRERVRTGTVKSKKPVASASASASGTSEEKKSAASSAPPKPQTYCTNKCGFFGSDQYGGLCSKCHRDKFGDPKNPPKKVRSGAELWKAAHFKLHLLQRWRQMADIDQKDKTRCWKCNRKVGLLGIQCRCRYYFCGKCRSPLDHGCQFDYVTLQQKKLKKENPLIEASKLDKM